MADVQDNARRVLDEAVNTAGALGADVEGHLVEGETVDELVKLSKDADMLVIGSHGLNRVVGALFGTTSLGCVHHSNCPVTVIPASYMP